MRSPVCAQRCFRIYGGPNAFKAIEIKVRETRQSLVQQTRIGDQQRTDLANVASGLAVTLEGLAQRARQNLRCSRGVKRHPRPINRVANVLGVDLTGAAKTGRFHNPREYSLTDRVQFRVGEELSSFAIAAAAAVASITPAASPATVASRHHRHSEWVAQQ